MRMLLRLMRSVHKAGADVFRSLVILKGWTLLHRREVSLCMYLTDRKLLYIF